MKTTNRCLHCSKEHRKCDQVKPICGRCKRLGKSCSYSGLYTNIMGNNGHQLYGHLNTFNIEDETFQIGRLKHKYTRQLMSFEEAVQRIQKENNISSSNISAKSIIFSSAKNRIAMFEFIKGSLFNNKFNNTIDKIYFNFYQLRKKDLQEMIW